MTASSVHRCRTPGPPAHGRLTVSWDCPDCGLRWYARYGVWRLGRRAARLHGLTTDGRPLR